MHCPSCDQAADRTKCLVIQARNDTIESKLRQRRCIDCGHIWWTVEVDLPPEAVKWQRENKDERGKFAVPRRVAGFRRIVFQ